jgi:hypothetical protein
MLCLHDRGFGGSVSGKGTAGVETGKFRPKRGENFVRVLKRKDRLLRMTKQQLIQLLVGQARANGFEFRKWYTGKLGRTWENAQQALEDLASERRYYVLLFSHEFASHFWKAGEQITFQVSKQTFKRRMADGTIGSVNRKSYTRRSSREDVWRYHLRELAVAEEPLRYMRRYLRVEEELDAETVPAPTYAPASQTATASRRVVGSAVGRQRRT